MSKFCGKCGSKLDEKANVCPNCDLIRANQNSEKVENQKFGKKLVLKIIVIIFVLIVAVATFFLLDYFDIIPTDISKLIGLKSSGSFQIESDKEYVFTSENEEYSVEFYCKPDVEFSSIELYCEDSNSYTASFSDDGNLEKNNNLKAGYGIYSVQISVKETEVKTLKYYAVMKDGLRYYISNTVEVEVKSDWTKDELSVMEKADIAIQELISKEDYKNKTFDQKFDSVYKILNELSEDENGALIITDSIYFDEESGVFSFEYSNCCLGCVSIEKNNEDSELIFGDSNSSFLTNSGYLNTNENFYQPAGNSNSDAVIMYDWYEDNDSVLEFYREYQEEWNKKGLDTELSINPTVEQYATQLSDNALILIAAHGSRYTLKSGLFKPSATCSVIATHEHCTNDLDKNYKFDINQKNIVRVNTEEGKYYWILPEFFSAHYSEGGLNDSIILIDSCYGFGEEDDIDYDLAGNMTGASAVVGFHNSVEIFNIYKLTQGQYVTKSFGTLFMENIVDNLLKSETVDTAFNKAKKTIGDTQFVFHQSYGYDTDEDDKSVYPLISGNANVKLNVSGGSSEYKVGKELIKIEDKYICSDGNAIYYKNSIVESGRKIVDKVNSGEILSDGETLYFTITNTCEVDEKRNELYSGNGTQIYYQDDIYSINIDGTNLKKVFCADHEVNFVTYYKNCIYYIDKAFESGKLMKFDFVNGKSKSLVNAENAYFIGNKIYYSTDIVVQNIDLIDKNVVNALDLDTENSEEIASSSTLFDCVLTDDALYFKSFDVEYDTKTKKMIYTDQYFYTVNKSNKIEKSPKLPNSNVIFDIGIDGSFVILGSFTTATQKLYYKYDVKTGTKTTILNNTSVNLEFINDLNNIQDLYCVIFPANSSNSEISVGINKLTENGEVFCKIDGENYIKINSYKYWIVDSFFVNDKFECFELTFK